MSAYYNEHDPFAAAWLRELIKAGHIPAGDVDERSIEDVTPDEIAAYDQCHFFAGIGGWPYALRLAGWPDDRPVWTGSCPCQPFSVAGKGKGTEDERHLWPEFARLIDECRPPVVFGEQVASKAGRAWLHDVRVDLEGMAYAVAAVDFCAASVGAPHIRQRLYWVADSGSAGLEKRSEQHARGERQALERNGGTGGLADAMPTGRPERGAESGGGQAPGLRGAGGLADSGGEGLAGLPEQHARPEREAAERGGGIDDPWSTAAWLPCRDGKARPVEPTIFPLAHGIPNRVGLLRGAGNAIVPQQAAAFIQAMMDCQP